MTMNDFLLLGLAATVFGGPVIVLLWVLRKSGNGPTTGSSTTDSSFYGDTGSNDCGSSDSGSCDAGGGSD